MKTNCLNDLIAKAVAASFDESVFEDALLCEVADRISYEDVAEMVVDACDLDQIIFNHVTVQYPKLPF